MVLYNNVGKEEYLRIKSYFKIPSLNLSGYKDITSPFDMTFKSRSYTNLELTNDDEIACKVKRNLEYDMMFDFDALLSGIPKNFLNEKALTKSIKELITNLAFLYELDPLKMGILLKFQ